MIYAVADIMDCVRKVFGAAANSAILCDSNRSLVVYSQADGSLYFYSQLNAHFMNELYFFRCVRGGSVLCLGTSVE